jgi:hypothetical protein
MDDMPAEERDYPPSAAKLSKTPSWIMLGFVLGVVFVLALPPRKPSPPNAPRPALTPPAKPTPPTVERAKFFEEVFAEWSKYAVWDNELTEVAFWNSETKAFSDRFEVFRSGDRYYFRSIAQFTRPVLTHGVPKDSPLQFTETVASREEWLRENADENVRTFLTPPPAAPPVETQKP